MKGKEYHDYMDLGTYWYLYETSTAALQKPLAQYDRVLIIESTKLWRFYSFAIESQHQISRVLENYKEKWSAS